MPRNIKKNEKVKVNNLLASMDETVAASFSFKQRKALGACLNTREWGEHKLDFRPTIAVPLLPWSFYFVFLAGVNKRAITPAERVASFFMLFISLFCLLMIVTICGLVLLYLVKSWLGIDLLSSESLGLWDTFNDAFK